MTTKTDQNGNGSKAVLTSTKPELSSVQVSPKIEEKVTKEVKPNLTFNQRSEKVRNLFSMIEKHEKLTETRDTLNNFKLSADAHTGKLSITDNHGSTFTTSNPSVIADVMSLIKNVVDNQIKEVEEQITF